MTVDPAESGNESGDDPLAEAKRELEELEQELSSRLKQMDASATSPKMDAAVGRLSFMDEWQQHQMAQHGRRNLETRLDRVRVARARVREGTYGRCTRCGADIQPERLEYMPETPFCVTCNR